MEVDRQSEKEFKDRLYEQFASICKAFGNPLRFQIMELLSQGEHSVEEVARELEISVANASQHLQVLRAARVVSVRRVGVWIYYSLASHRIFHLLYLARTLAEENLPDVKRILEEYLPHRQQEDMVGFQDLFEILNSETASVVDVRPEAEFRAGHICGANSLPLGVLADQLDKLPVDKPIVVTCRGPYSLLSDRAVAFLRMQGYEARRFEQGFPEWRLKDYPVTSSRD